MKPLAEVKEQIKPSVEDDADLIQAKKEEKR